MPSTSTTSLAREAAEHVVVEPREARHVGQHAAGRAVAEDQPGGLDLGAGPGEVARRVAAGRERLDLERGSVERDRASGLERPPVDAAVVREDRQHRDSRRSGRGGPRRSRTRGSASRTRAAAAGPPCGRSPRPSAGPRPRARRARRPRARRRAPRAAGAGPARRWPGTTDPSAPRIASDDCVRGRAAAPARAASHVGQRQFHCGKPPPAAEPRIRTRIQAMIEVGDERRGDRSPAGRGGGRRPRRRRRRPLVHELDARFDGRLARAAADADPVAVVHVARELRARRVAVVALDEPDADGLQTAAARAVRAHRGGGTVAWALDESLPLAPDRQVQALVEGAVLGGYDAGRWKSGGPRARRRRASSSAARRTELARGRGARRAGRALDERRARARRRRRRTSSTPAGLAERAAALPGLRVEVLDPVAAGLPALAAVGGSSAAAAAAHRPAPRARRRAGRAAARARRQGGHLRRGRLLPQAAVGHRAPEGRHGRRRGGARRARRDRRARAAALGPRRPPGLREHARPRRDPAVGRDHDRRRPHRRGDEPGRRGPADPRRRALVRARARARRTSSTSRR